MQYFSATKSIVNGNVVYGNLPLGFVVGYEDATMAFFQLLDEVPVPSNANINPIGEQDYNIAVQTIRDAYEADRQAQEQQLIAEIRAKRWAQMTPIERYDEADRDTISLDDLKALKFAVIEQWYREHLVLPFTSTNGHTYSYDEIEDQKNFAEQGVMLGIDPDVDSVEWMTMDAGLVDHTREEFIALLGELATRKRAYKQTQWILQRINLPAATTAEEVDLLVWPE